MRLGLFGGTFDPPHVGHLLAASDAVESLSLDRLVFIPNAAQPLKAATPGASAQDRLAMVRLLCQGDPRFDVDALEVERGGLSFMVDTLRAYRSRYPDAALFLLVGEDVVQTLSSWREAAEVGRLAEIVVLARRAADTGHPTIGHTQPGAAGGGGERLRRIETRRVDVSASEIRDRLRAGKSVIGFLTDSVRAYVEAHALYR